jgi:hypothetical protein
LVVVEKASSTDFYDKRRLIRPLQVRRFISHGGIEN